MNFKTDQKKFKLTLIGSLLIFAAIPVTVFLILVARSYQAPAQQSTASTPLIDKQDVVVIGERKVCSFVGPNQTAVGISGEDGGESVRVGSTTYFGFGDTNTSFGQLPNSVATTTDTDASDCFSLTSKSSAGKAVPMLPKLTSECTVWPLDMVNTAGNDIYFFYYSFSVTNCSSRLGFGLGKMDAATLETTRINNFFWRPNDTETPNFDIFGGTFIRSGSDLYVLWNGQNSTGQDLNMLSKVTIGSIENKVAYTYWDGTSFQADPAKMVPVWDQGPVPTHGMTIRFNNFLNKWTAVYNTGYSSVMAMRTADNLTGPWSSETNVINCLQHFALGSSSGAAFPCYGGKEHQSFEKNNGQIIYTSHSNILLYQPFLHEIIFGKAVNQWVDASGNAEYKLDGTQEASFNLEGAAFYASPNPLPGFAEIREWKNSSGEIVYSATSPSGSFTSQGIAFYAPISQTFSLAPIYQWNKGSLHRYSNIDLSSYGYSKGQVAFYAKITSYRIDDTRVFQQNGSSFQIGVKDAGNWVAGAKLKSVKFSGLTSGNSYSIVSNTPFLGNRFFGQNILADSSGEVSFSGDLPYVNVVNLGVFRQNQNLDTSSDLFTYWVHNKGVFNNPAEIGHQLNPFSRAGNFKSFFSPPLRVVTMKQLFVNQIVPVHWFGQEM